MSNVVSHQAPRVGFVSLGCPKALVDSERIITNLRSEGYDIAPDYQGADIVVVNTCGFIESAVNESLDAIGEALNENGKVIVTGCLGAKKDVILSKHPEVLEVTGPHAYEDVMRAVHKHLPPSADPFTSLVPAQGIKLTPKHYAYVKISEGCNHSCTFCIIPSMRGKLKSRTIDEVLTEAHKLKQAGVKELLIISQDTSAYGVDTKFEERVWADKKFRTKFYDLCKALSDFGIWVRLHYVYPYPHVDEVISLMREGALLPYLDIPFQHANSRILKLMKRPASSENNLERIRAWRSVCPDLTIRSTFIVGFPGETEAEFEELLTFLEAAQLDRVGCFKYSPVEGAKANDLPDAVPEEVKEERYHRFMELQSKISAQRLQAKIGKTMQVLVDEIREDAAVARSMADAPEIDGLVFIENAPQLKPGQFANVKIINANEYDLFAELA
jgi:ribosomal protein S12 methylthiotransferase